MRTRTMMMVVALAAIVALGVFAGDEILGRDVARGGSLQDVSGSLLYDGNEWFLTDAATTYELHMGPYGHDETLPFVDGAGAVVQGFVLDEHIAPLQVITGSETHEFWHESRYPLWAGNGALRNAGGSARDDFEPAYRNQDLRPGRGR